MSSTVEPIILTEKTVAAVTKLYVDAVCDGLRDRMTVVLSTEIDRIRKGLHRELSGPDAFAGLFAAVNQHQEADRG